MQAKAVQQFSGESLGFGGQNRPVHPLFLQSLQPLGDIGIGLMQSKPAVAICLNRIGALASSRAACS